MPSNVKLLAGASGGEPTDANFKNVTLLLHGDGSNGAQNNTFIDSSTNNFTITRNGNTTQGSFSPYGSNWSNYFDGNGDYISMPSNAAFAFGTGDYTIEGWFYPTVGGIDQRLTWFSDDRHNIDINTSNQIFLYDGSIRTFGTVNINSWNHFAVSRSGGTVSCYLNGVRGYNASETTNSTTRSMNIGANNVANGPFNGYISNMRVVKGTAVYSGSTITVPTAPLTAITNTSLLTCADNRFRDGSTNNFTITRNGDVKVTNFAPFAPSSAYSTTTNGGSAYFDGSGDFLDTNDNSAFQFGSGDFTYEAWIYTTKSHSTSSLIQQGLISWGVPNQFNNSYTLNLGIEPTSGVLAATVGTGFTLTGTTAIPLNTWTHVVLCRTSGRTSIFINGVRDATTTTASTLTTNAGAILRLGGQWYADSSLRQFGGYMSDARIIKGAGPYDAASTTITVPTSPVSAITNTSLLCKPTNAAIFDNSMKNDLETVGNAQISTSVKKFGTGSMYFNGSTSNRIKPPASDLYTFGTGNFTVEAWIYVTNMTTENFVFDTRSSVSTSGMGFSLEPNTGKLRYSGNANNVLTSTSVSANTWTHVAWVRNNGTLTGYINGVSGGSASNSDNLTQTNGEVGNVPFSAVATNMYIDDLRITKGIARYTANFTAPTAPFPNK